MPKIPLSPELDQNLLHAVIGDLDAIYGAIHNILFALPDSVERDVLRVLNKRLERDIAALIKLFP